MIQAVESYLAVRHAAGFDLKNAEYLLRSFAYFAAERKETNVRATMAIDWASQSSSLAQRDARLKTVCRFARYLRAEDNRHEVPPADHFGYRKTRRVPHIYSHGEINRLIDAALGLPGTLQPQTYATLIGLLVATGLRISEALSLQFSDVTTGGLLIRKTKFQTTRLVPLHETTEAGLDRYLICRRRVHSKGEDVFVIDDGRRLPYWHVHRTYRKLLKTANVSAAGSSHHRLHEMRHTFAVRALEASPAGRQRIGQHMLALATYMGHVNINDTYWYLEITPELLRDIAVASESFLCGGQQ
jgi:integrase/recombinase XerD